MINKNFTFFCQVLNYNINKFHILDLPQKYHIKFYIAIIVGLISILSGAYQAINEVIEIKNVCNKYKQLNIFMKLLTPFNLEY
jgi:hypothetical protein